MPVVSLEYINVVVLDYHTLPCYGSEMDYNMINYYFMLMKTLTVCYGEI